MRRKAKVDDNQKQIVESLRKIPGVTVAITSMVANGYPDINVGFKGLNYLIELKDGKKVASKKRLKPDQEKFQAAWKGQYSVCESLEDVLRVLKITA